MVKYVFSIPLSNAAVERLFSILLNLWTDERNRLSMDVVKAEICCSINLKKSFLDFAEWVKSAVDSGSCTRLQKVLFQEEKSKMINDCISSFLVAFDLKKRPLFFSLHEVLQNP
jgi:hypothetical protein